jgi:hypothetical protein
VDQFVQVPYTGEIIPSEALGYKLAMINKGNVLQYKKNSSNLTQWQKYSQIAKGQWVNRTKTWATQSTRGYTNPNNMSLIRSGGQNVTLAGVPTGLPVTCPKIPINNNPILPSTGGGGPSTPPLPPPPPPPSNGGTVIPIIPLPIVEPIVIQDFGNLVCGTFENLCTGEIIQPIKLDNCHPTTDSDVPGPIQELCWNDGNPTFYPRQRYIMTNSTNKWPVNAVLGSAVKPSTPILSEVLIDCNIVTLFWSFDFECLPISRYNIYQDGRLIANINGGLRSYTISVDTSGTHSFYITAENNGIISDISNTVSVNIDPTPAPINLTINTVCNIASLSWADTSPCILTYQVYANGSLIATTTNTNYNFILQDNISYTFYIVAFLGSIASDNSNTVTAIYVPYYLTPPTISGLGSTVTFLNDTYTYTFTSGTGTVTFTDITNVIGGSVTVIGGGGKGGNGGVGDPGLNYPGGGGGGGGSGALNTSAFLPIINTSYGMSIGVGATVSIVSTSSTFDSITSNPGGNGLNGQSTNPYNGGSGGGGGVSGTGGASGGNGGSGNGGTGGVILGSYGKGGDGGDGGDSFNTSGAEGNNGVVILSIQLSC